MPAIALRRPADGGSAVSVFQDDERDRHEQAQRAAAPAEEIAEARRGDEPVGVRRVHERREQPGVEHDRGLGREHDRLGEPREDREAPEGAPEQPAALGERALALRRAEAAGHLDRGAPDQGAEGEQADEQPERGELDRARGDRGRARVREAAGAGEDRSVSFAPPTPNTNAEETACESDETTR